MSADGHAPLSSDELIGAFAKAMKRKTLWDAERDFVRQAALDFRADELPIAVGSKATGGDVLAADLAAFWRFAERREGATPMIRLREAGQKGVRYDVLEIVQDDAPFLVDSVMGELGEAGFQVRAMFHPVAHVARDPSGARVVSGDTRAESMILVMLEPVGEDRAEALLDGVRATLADVRAAVEDFPLMGALLRRTADELSTTAPDRGGYGVAEYRAFLDWMAADRFVLLGARTYEYPRLENGDYAPEEPRFRAEDGLGVLRDPARSVLRRASEPAVLTHELKTYLEHAAPLAVAKSNLRSRVHRRAYMDYVGVKRYAPDGAVTGEVRFVGLFTLEAYEARAADMPLVRRKVEHVLAQAGANPSQHTEKRLRNILETYPRDELFQIEEADLFQTAMGVLHLYDRPRVRLFARKDGFDRFVSVLLYVPRDRYDSDVRERAGNLLAEAWGGRLSAYYPNFATGPLARVHFVIGITPGAHRDPDPKLLEAQITELVRTWQDHFEAAVRMGGAVEGQVAETLARYSGAFPAGYRDRYAPDQALTDLNAIEAMLDKGAPLAVRAYRAVGDSALRFRFKLYRPTEAVPLADVLPILENMGLKALTEAGFPVRRCIEGVIGPIWVHEFELEDERGENLSFASIRAPFEATFLAVWSGEAENDGFNRLVLELGVSWREASLMRAFARYRQQTGLDPSQTVQEAALRDHPGVARLMLDLFRVKFDPAIAATAERRGEQADGVFAEITAALQQVESLDADRVLRRLALLVRAMKRTNYYQFAKDVNADGTAANHPYISFKIASSELEDLPLPKPYREIFVCSPQVEGVHLRFGPVARGGLRWSDRRDDFRTEVLGLVKAQQVKNAVIVPVGSKGGFYPKMLPRGGTGDAVRAAGVAAYRTFLSGLLDITDNLDARGKVIRPPAVIAHEGDDPYLVVAADKGTATFSDIANGVAQDYGFWLGDAFASGGSVGYDHKVMGITARGAWEAVKRHFREMGKDIGAEPFTCVGVGDMSGDVFGNGMLQSRATLLLAAFDHRHIFLDPAPDTTASWAERKRLFDLPRSSWDDYDKALISPGGGVWPRSAKSIDLSPEVQAMLGVSATSFAPTDLIRAILKAPVELLYLGGIGTYVKAASESNADVGDKAGDAVRVDAGELRAKVVGEGANLGFTQAGRIAFARDGGRINTDAIDNSAGVDTSDHEVNIKILLGQAERLGALDPAARPALLAEMTDEVGEHVLAHNYAQTLCLSLQEASAPADVDAHARFMLDLESRGRLDRKVEGLPRALAMSELKTAGRGLTRPELAVLTAYAKLELSADIVAGHAPDDAYFEKMLTGYFPAPLAKFEKEMKQHRLRREIIATVLANTVVDMTGATFPTRLQASAECDAGGMVTAFEAARQLFRIDETWASVNRLDLVISAKAQTALCQELADVLRGQTFWLARKALTPGVKPGVRGLIDAYRPAADALMSPEGEALLSPVEQAAVVTRRDGFVALGVDATLAARVAALRPLTAVSDIADIAKAFSLTPLVVGGLYHKVAETFGFDRLRAATAGLWGGDAYERRALRGLILDLIAEQGARTRDILTLAKGKKIAAPEAAIAAWVELRREPVDRAVRTLDEIDQTPGGWSFAKLTIANAAVKAIA